MARASGNFRITVGKLQVGVKLFKLQNETDAPKPTIRCDCRAEVAVIEKCPTDGLPIRVTGVQDTGNAAGSPATEPVDKVCPNCKEKHKKYDRSYSCPNCKKDLEAKDLVTFLASGDTMVQVSPETLLEWKKLFPEAGVMLPVAVAPTNTVSSVFRDVSYQVVPDDGEVRGFALWLAYLRLKGLGVIVRFRLSGNPKTGLLYAASVRSVPRLILATLYSLEEITFQDFEIPDTDPGLVARLGQVVEPLRKVRIESVLTNPEDEAFRTLHDEGVEAGLAKMKFLSPVPFEDEVLTKALDAELNPPPPPKAKAIKKKAKSDVPAPATP